MWGGLACVLLIGWQSPAWRRDAAPGGLHGRVVDAPTWSAETDQVVALDRTHRNRWILFGIRAHDPDAAAAWLAGRGTADGRYRLNLPAGAMARNGLPVYRAFATAGLDAGRDLAELGILAGVFAPGPEAGGRYRLAVESGAGAF